MKSKRWNKYWTAVAVIAGAVDVLRVGGKVDSADHEEDLLAYIPPYIFFGSES